MTEGLGSRPSERTLLYIFIAAALTLRLPGHLGSGLWFDEIWMLDESVRVPFASLFTTFASDNNHPLYSIFAWMSVQTLGESAWALRLPALLFGVASVGMMWRLALLIAPRAEALLATTLLTISYHHVWFSQNARGYTMLLFWTLAATYFLLRGLAGAGQRAWGAYAVCLALATFTHASGVFVALGHALVVAGDFVRASAADPSERGGPRWAPVAGIMAAGAISLVLHAGMLGDMIAFVFAGPALDAVTASEGPSEWTSPWWTVRAVVESLGVPPVIGYTALVVGTSLVVAGTVVTYRRSPKLALLFLLPGVITLLAMVGMGRSLRPRFFFHFAGFGLLIVVAGIFAISDWIARRAPSPAKATFALRGAAGVVSILASLAILPEAYTLPKQDFEGALEYVRTERRPGEVVVTAGLTVLPYRTYYGADFPEVRSAAELDRVLEQNDSVLLLHTIPIYLETSAPDLAARLVPSAEVARFRGSLGDGDVVVFRLSRWSSS